MLQIVGGAENNDPSCKIRIIDWTTDTKGKHQVRLRGRIRQCTPSSGSSRLGHGRKEERQQSVETSWRVMTTGSAEGLPAWGESLMRVAGLIEDTSLEYRCGDEHGRERWTETTRTRKTSAERHKKKARCPISQRDLSSSNDKPSPPTLDQPEGKSKSPEQYPFVTSISQQGCSLLYHETMVGHCSVSETKRTHHQPSLQDFTRKASKQCPFATGCAGKGKDS